VLYVQLHYVFSYFLNTRQGFLEMWKPDRKIEDVRHKHCGREACMLLRAAFHMLDLEKLASYV